MCFVFCAFYSFLVRTLIRTTKKVLYTLAGLGKQHSQQPYKWRSSAIVAAFVLQGSGFRRLTAFPAWCVGLFLSCPPQTGLDEGDLVSIQVLLVGGSVQCSPVNPSQVRLG